MSASDLAQVMEQYHRAQDAFVKGDPEPVKQVFSRRDDVTLANPLVPPVPGWSQVEKTIEFAASQVRGQARPLREYLGVCDGGSVVERRARAGAIKGR